MMTKVADVFVVGGGPAGLAAAIAARRKGFSVTLADGAVPPIDKPCGEGLMPETQAALRELGVQLPPSLGYSFRGIRFVDGSRSAAADFPRGTGVGVRRPLLHEWLIQAAEACGVRLLWKTTVCGISHRGVQLTQEWIRARWIVGADGAGSRVRRWCGLDALRHSSRRAACRRHYRVPPWTNYMEIHWGRRAQAYVTPISDKEVCVVSMAEQAQEADFTCLLEELPELRERLRNADLGSQERGAVTARYAVRRVVRGNIALVGDASGGVDAITGEGLRLAFRQAQAFVESIAREDLQGYERQHRRLARKPTCMGALLLQLTRSERLRARVLSAFAADPELFPQVLSLHTGPARPRDLLAAGVRFSWEFLAA